MLEGARHLEDTLGEVQVPLRLSPGNLVRGILLLQARNRRFERGRNKVYVALLVFAALDHPDLSQTTAHNKTKDRRQPQMGFHPWRLHSQAVLRGLPSGLRH